MRARLVWGFFHLFQGQLLRIVLLMGERRDAMERLNAKWGIAVVTMRNGSAGIGILFSPLTSEIRMRGMGEK